MRVKLEDVCEQGSSNVKQSDIPKNKGLYEIYGASGLAGKVDFYHRDKPYVAVVKDGAGIGRTMFLHGKTSVIGTLQYLIPKDNILPKYLYYVVKYMNLSKYFTGATIPHIYYRDYKNEEFNLSSIDDQKTIVNQLEALECIIELRTEELKKLDELVKARFVEMFKDEDPVFAFDDVLIDDTKNGFKLDSSNYSNLGKIAIVDQGQKRICGYINAVDGKAPWSKEAIIFGDHTEMFKYINFPFYLGADGAKLLSPKNGWNARFLYHYLDVNYHKRLGYMRHFKYLKEMSFIKPDLYRQEEFCMFCTQVDKSKFAVQKSLEKTQLLFDSLMQEYFG